MPCRVKTKTRALRALSLGVCLGAMVFPQVARADVKISDIDGFQFSTNGRVNAFLSYLNADGYPTNIPGQPHNFSAGAGLESNQVDNSDKVNSFRIRSGFVGAVLGFTLETQLNEQNAIRAHIETWNTIETQRQKAAPNPTDVPEAWGKVEGSWGGRLFGRALALFRVARSYSITTISTRTVSAILAMRTAAVRPAGKSATASSSPATIRRSRTTRRSSRACKSPQA